MNKLLIVDDDQPLRERLARAMLKRDYDVEIAESLEQAREILTTVVPDYAVLDLKLKDGYGLELVNDITSKNANAKVIILTGYGNIASAVAAIKHGAVDYLPKPADADMVDRALRPGAIVSEIFMNEPMSPDRVKWEHIQRVFNECDQNISETARQLKMHRRTLQRILAKHAPRG